MLDRLLALLERGGIHTVADLAAELGTTPELVELMLEELQRFGKLIRLNMVCPANCAGCRYRGTCAVKFKGGGYAIFRSQMSGSEPGTEGTGVSR